MRPGAVTALWLPALSKVGNGRRRSRGEGWDLTVDLARAADCSHSVATAKHQVRLQAGMQDWWSQLLPALIVALQLCYKCAGTR